jgi:hypothetical protein
VVPNRSIAAESARRSGLDTERVVIAGAERWRGRNKIAVILAGYGVVGSWTRGQSGPKVLPYSGVWEMPTLSEPTGASGSRRRSWLSYAQVLDVVRVCDRAHTSAGGPDVFQLARGAPASSADSPRCGCAT